MKGKDWEGRLPPEQVRICADHGIGIVYLDTVLDSSSRILEQFLSGKQNHTMNITEFEQRVLEQQPVGSGHYDAEYFTGDWRDEGNNYNLETRRQIEAKNPSLIKDVFQPKKVLDLGCGPGALMHLLWELGVDVDGIDFAESSRQLATPRGARPHHGRLRRRPGAQAGRRLRPRHLPRGARAPDRAAGEAGGRQHGADDVEVHLRHDALPSRARRPCSTSPRSSTSTRRTSRCSTRTCCG